jgi:Zn2+/Cd2+-exporting ATPase
VPDLVKTTLYIEAMDCPTEEQLIRNRLKRLDGVDDLHFDLVNRELTVSHQSEDPEPVLKALQGLRMPGVPTDPTDEESSRSWERKPIVSRFEWIQLSVAGVLALAAELIPHATGAGGEFLPLGLALTAVLLGGREMLAKGWRAVRSLSLGINFLMTIAVAGAILIREWPEAAMVTVLFAIAEKIEAYALDRSRGAIRELMKLSKDTAMVLMDDGSWKDVRTASIKVGQRVRIRPGELLPLDGVVVAGASTVNQAPITGESMPVEKEVGNEVLAGTLNEQGSLEVEVTRAKRDTTLAKIIRAVQQAQAEKGATQRFVDKFAKYYTPSVVVAAILVAIMPPLFLGASFGAWFYRALVLLVIACPCALVISTPVTVVSGLAAAARRGILVKGGAYLEIGHKLRAIAFDKTGTLTEGRPAVTGILPVEERITEREALLLAASLESHSEHPVAQSVVQAWQLLDPETPPRPVEGFQAMIGRGVRGEVEGTVYHIGNHRYAHESGVCTPELEAKLESLEREGKTAVVLFDADAPLAVIGVADTLRAASVEAVMELGRMGMQTVMLTGDNQITANAIAREAGIADARGELLPEDKLQAISVLREEFGPVGMIGDGINDAPALATADIGFAMGGAGTDTAIETADVALMKDDLRKLPVFLRLSRKTHGILWQNISLALGIKAVFFGLAIAGTATLWMAVFADMGASLLVTFNGLRLLRGSQGG